MDHSELWGVSYPPLQHPCTDCFLCAVFRSNLSPLSSFPGILWQCGGEFQVLTENFILMESSMIRPNTEWDDSRCIHLRGEREGRCDAVLVWPEDNFLNSPSPLQHVSLLSIDKAPLLEFFLCRMHSSPATTRRVRSMAFAFWAIPYMCDQMKRSQLSWQEMLTLLDSARYPFDALPESSTECAIKKLMYRMLEGMHSLMNE